MIEGGLQTTGVACGQFVGYGFFFVKDQAQWRGPVGIQLLPAAIVFIFINFLPESPCWLIKHGMLKEGTYNLAQLRGLCENDPTLAERDAIVVSLEAQAGEAPFSYRELLSNGKTKTFHRVAIGFFIQAAQQLSGINMVSTYANKILADSFNLAPGLSHLIAACGGAVCALLTSVLSVDRGPRTKTCVHVDRIRHDCLLCDHCRSVIYRKSYPAARRRRVSLPLQYLLRSCMGWPSIPLFSRNRATEVQSPSERHRQCRQLDLLLRRSHDNPACNGEPWLENLHVSAKQTDSARPSKKKKS
jgi:hypothetical protein